MVEVRTLVQLQDALDKELSWRKKEVTAFDLASRQGGDRAKFFTRAGVALLYAHWEGFVKSAAELYLSFVHFRGLKYSELASCFSVVGLKGSLDLLSASKKSMTNITVFDFIRDKLGQRANLKLSSAIRTDSNLSSAVFTNILATIGIDPAPYETKYNLIDQSLVERRNKVAHGENLDLKGSDFSSLVEEVLILMEQLKTDLLNAAVLESFKAKIA